MTRAAKGTPTALNVWSLARVFGDADRVPNAVEPTRARALRRCLDAGLVIVDGSSLALTAAGRDAVAKHRAGGA